MLHCEVAQLCHDHVFSASGRVTSSTATRADRKECYSPNCASKIQQSSCVRVVSQNYVQFSQQFPSLLFIPFVSCWTELFSGLLNLSIFILPFKKGKSVCDMCRFQYKVSERNSLKLTEEPKIAKSPGFQELCYIICYQMLTTFVKQFKWLIQITCSKVSCILE